MPEGDTIHRAARKIHTALAGKTTVISAGEISVFLPSPWQEVSHANPIFYMVNTIRSGFLGSTDVNVRLAFGVAAVIAAGMMAWAQWLFTTGHN